MRKNTAGLWLFFCMLMLIGAASAAAAKEIKVNLVISPEQLMIYAGASDGLKVGNTYTIMRDGRAIGTVEIIKVETTYSIAKVVKADTDIKEMDALVPPTPQSAGIPAGTGGPTTSAPTSSDTGDKDKKDKDSKDKKEKKDKTADKDTKDKKDKDTKDKKEKTTKDKKEKKDKTADKDAKDESKDKTADKDKAADKDAKDKKDDKAAATPAKKAPREIRTGSLWGPTGLYQMPTAFVAASNSGSITYFMIKESRSGSGTSAGTIDADEPTAYSSSRTLDTRAYSLTYGVNENFEFSIAQVKVDITAAASLNSYWLSGSASMSDESKYTVVSVKYNPRKKYLLKGNTTKQFQYAFGLQHGSASGDNQDWKMYYGAVSFPLTRMNLHGTVYYISGSTADGKNWGSMAGLELPVIQNLSLVGDVDQYHGESTYTVGLRYIINDQGALSLGLFDPDDVSATMLTGTFQF